MKFFVSGAALLLSLSFSASADNEQQAQREISHLLNYLQASDCEFYRNGDWHDSARAVTHLNRKYRWLDKRDLVPSTEAFIERAATESSRSGKAYLVRCPGEAEVESAQWLHEELAEFRTAEKTPESDN
ncbi:hypothetical protein F6455_07455 [Proteobacteria bacterium 005FR1]|nr:hypothetical protein [Proteobacteria bacterium 005FR1]